VCRRARMHSAQSFGQTSNVMMHMYSAQLYGQA
jgi:hypothetical protein